jgi:hypothetical protein
VSLLDYSFRTAYERLCAYGSALLADMRDAKTSSRASPHSSRKAEAPNNFKLRM